MHHFEYRGGVLHAEDVAIPDIAAAIGTPFYCYSSATLERHYRVFADAFKGQPARVCYSVKANSNLAVVATLARQGAGADVVSEGELRRALAAGIEPAQIVFSGVGKTEAEMSFALETGIDRFNVESEPELELLSQLASARGLTARVAIRVNPDVDAKTHEKIATGKAENKFGISWKRAPSVYDRAKQLPGIEANGIDVHIGSQLTDLAPFEAAFARVAAMVEELRARGHAIAHIDLGGGLGIPYRGDNDVPPHPDEYARMVKRTMGHLGCSLTFEPGRLIAGNAGILVSRVIYEKQGDDRNFLILDAAMNDLIRPTLYDAFHEIRPVAEGGAAERVTYDVVGPVCETGDFFAKGRELPRLQSGELVAIMSAGAYGAVQASTYNTRPLVPEVMVKGDVFAEVRARPSYDAMLKQDIIPSWLD
ncbi:diaminopimelate decarboxylase [Parvibaculum sp.]|jgi:diaminopimelate decarboxylase|uniref:diaminopimelate decarboxylase n=1 Tax=Parvibaculum sp. TaxID=2024848 RepID=UPI000C4D64FD|nr:diaminopimelate decarboxylase [Parvibaculum sp.]MAU60883.1 diaminopimelate decarboxylase [Parvibaculum sp.]MBO6668719.1 diaminopimelate decarboxylase [Parvibaculum sp.]MBO6714396.1 diaminopimelate decarboxylase [Parvibaculum sp.]HAC57597.1 diaminopimelate decarboxylase [Rhodobiaceae bacterium]|tara:strand:+ start:4026 stop:5291 length:1266 start_codon:yes stop_codon:yes gene_type:complete